MVVDDQSPDGTGEIADPLAAEFPGRVEVLHRTGKRGLGRSYIDALTIARARATPISICQMDADLSHDPHYLPDMVEAAADGADMVIGSRYLHGVSVVNWPLQRLFLSTFANHYIRTVTRLPVATAPAASAAGGARRSSASRSSASSRTATRSSSRCSTKRTAAAAGSAKCRSSSSSAASDTSKMSSGVILESVYMPWRVVLRGMRGGA